jgi:hypothetical protein
MTNATVYPRYIPLPNGDWMETLNCTRDLIELALLRGRNLTARDRWELSNLLNELGTKLDENVTVAQAFGPERVKASYVVTAPAEFA